MAIYLLRTKPKNRDKHPLIKPHIVKLLEKEINKECQEMCHKTIKVKVIPESETQPKSRRELFSASSIATRKRKIPAEQSNDVAAKNFMKNNVRCKYLQKDKQRRHNCIYL
jgi:hypothetical protein